MDELLRQEDLNLGETAKVLRLSTVTVSKLMDEGELKYWQKTANGGRRVYTWSVLRYIREVQGRDIGGVNPKNSSRG